MQYELYTANASVRETVFKQLLHSVMVIFTVGFSLAIKHIGKA